MILAGLNPNSSILTNCEFENIKPILYILAQVEGVPFSDTLQKGCQANIVAATNIVVGPSKVCVTSGAT